MYTTYSSQLYLHSDIHTFIHSSIHALIFTEPIRTTIRPGALSLRNVLLYRHILQYVPRVRTPQMSEKHVIGPAVSTGLYILTSTLLTLYTYILREPSPAVFPIHTVHRYTGKELILIGGQSGWGGGGKESGVGLVFCGLGR